jgi:ribose 5-phosphate isomerase B
MRIHLAADSSGYALARDLEAALAAEGHEVVWHAAPEFDEGDDYPIYAVRVGQAVIADEDAGIPVRGVLVGASGAGEAIAANKVPGVRAVAGLAVDYVRSARQHADADILTLGADFVDAATARELVEALVAEPFHDLLEDARRIVNTNEFESHGTIEGWMIEG